MEQEICYSIIIPTNNRDDMLRNAIDSALQQTYKPAQIVIVDNYTKGDTRKMIEAMTHDPDCPILFLECADFSHARNYAVENATGNYIAFLDDDDLWHKNYLSRVAKTVTNERVDFVLTRAIDLHPDGTLTPGKMPPAEYRQEDFFLRNPGILCSNFVVSKEKFDAIEGYDESIGSSGDKELFMRLKAIGCSHKVLVEELVYWRAHPKNLSRNAARNLPFIFRFYRKYFFDMSPKYHLLMARKFVNLLYMGYIRPLVHRG